MTKDNVKKDQLQTPIRSNVAGTIHESITYPLYPKEIESEINAANASASTNASTNTSANEETTVQGTLPRGLHAPPPHAISTSNKYLWDVYDGDSPLSPPESSSRSISFEDLAQNPRDKCMWPFQFMREQESDLIFNQGTLTSSSISPRGSKLFSPSASPKVRVKQRSTYSSLPQRNVNIAPAGLGEFDYHIGITSEISWIKSLFLEALYLPLSVINTLINCCGRRKVLMIIALVVLVSGSITYVATSRKTVPSVILVTGAGNETLLPLEFNHTSRRILLMDRLVNANVTLEHLFDDVSSPQHAALEWILSDDPLQMDPADDDLVTRYACVVFYFSVSHWDEEGATVENESWLSGRDICEWSGIVCRDDSEGDDFSSSKVVEFHFTSGDIDGPLVREILLAFKELQVLRISGAGLKGAIPKAIGLLANLQVLSLGNNNLSGSLPSELGMLKSLNILGLHNNNFSDSVPHEIWHLTQLSALYLDGNNFKGEIPTDVNNLIMLTDLRLRNNKFNGTLPAMGDLSELQILYLDTNHFSGPLPGDLGRLQKLLHLHVYQNKLGHFLPPKLTSLGNLVQFVADHNNFTGTLPSELMQLPNLKKIWLQHNRLNGTVPLEACERKRTQLEIKVDCKDLSCSCCDGCSHVGAM